MDANVVAEGAGLSDDLRLGDKAHGEPSAGEWFDLPSSFNCPVCQ